MRRLSDRAARAAARSHRSRMADRIMTLSADARLPALRLARRRVADRARSASPTTRARPSTRCSTPASRSRARSSRRSTASPTPRSRGSTARRCTCPKASHAAATRLSPSRACWPPAQDYEIGGMQLPCVVEMAANSFFSKAGIGIGGGGMLTIGNANLLMVHGTPAQQAGVRAARVRGPLLRHDVPVGAAGRLVSLSDIATRAEPDGATSRRSARPALPPDAATRCGSRPASTS